jgi:hypothetical protein
VSAGAGLRAGLRLTRPRQWPILSAQLALGVILAVPAAGASVPDVPILLAAWLAWVPLLNGGTLAFNSAYDRDTGPVAYLRHPPPPPRGLAGWALGAMLAGAALGAIVVGSGFGLVVLACVVLSVLYSHPRTRWKSRPGLDLLVNMAGYGAGTTLAGLAAGRAAGLVGAGGGGWFVAGFALLFGSLYPLTQIYQYAEDRARGDRTLATALGVRPSLALALALGLAAAVSLGAGTDGASPAWRTALAATLLVWTVHLAFWWLRAPAWTARDHERGMYRALVMWVLVDLVLAGLRLA